MKFIHACRRDEPPCGGASLDQLISPDNEVRLIDAFVDSLALEKLGFRMDFPENGRPAYHSSILLKRLLAYLRACVSSFTFWGAGIVCWYHLDRIIVLGRNRVLYLQIAIFNQLTCRGY